VSKIRTLVSLSTLLLVVGWGWAIAQSVAPVERPAFGARFDVPADWVGELVDADDANEMLSFTAPSEAGLVVVVLGRLSAEEAAELVGVGPEGVWDAWEGFSSGMPDLRAEREGVRTVAGLQAGVIDYVGDGTSGSVVAVVDGAIGLTVVSIAYEGGAAVIGAGLETILTSFGFASTGAPAPVGGGNPLAPPARSAAGGAGNPLAPAAPVSATSSASEASYREPFTSTDPSSTFGGVLDVGFDGTWTAALTGSAYRLTNEAAPDAVRYYYLMGLPGEAGPLAQGTLGVTLGMAPGAGGLSAAGLLFDFDPNDGTYLAFALTTTGYVVLQRSAEGLELLVDEALDTLRPDGRNRLELRAAGSAVEVVVNGETAATLNGSQPFSGGVGLVALGAGVFEFQDFHYQRP
jgi:hypothetical protein